MKKIVLFAVLFIMNSTFCFSQDILFENCFAFGSSSNIGDVLGSRDGYYYVAVNTNHQDSARVIKFDYANTEIWNYKVPSLEVLVWRLFEDQDGSVFVVSAHDVGSLLTTGQESDDICLIKLTTDGSFVWEKHFGGSNSDHPVDITEDQHGNIVLSCNGYSSDGTFSDSHGDAEGNIIVVSRETGDNLNSFCIGGSGSDQVKGTFATPTGSAVIGSTYSSDGDFSILNATPTIWQPHTFFLSVDNGGNIVDGYTVLDTGMVFSVAFSGMEDQYYCAGSKYGQGYVSLITSSGIVWERLLEPAFMNRIIATSDGGCLAVGSSDMDEYGIVDSVSSHAFFVKYDRLGNLIWKKHVGNSSLLFARAVSEIIAVGKEKKEYVIGGLTQSSLFNCDGGAYGAWIVRLQDDSVLNTSIDDMFHQSAFILYPNPTSGSVTVRTKDDKALLFITDLSGQTVFMTSMTGHEMTISPNISSGMYVMHINRMCQKFIVQ